MYERSNMYVFVGLERLYTIMELNIYRSTISSSITRDFVPYLDFVLAAQLSCVTIEKKNS